MKRLPISIMAIAILIAISSGAHKKAGVTTGDQAVALVKKSYPAFQDYPSDNLPPKTIEATSTPEGWRVGMYMNGSGLPGILRADCFLVTASGKVTQIGFFNGEGPAKSINLATCTPKD
jgi:hypothetical protein